MTVRGCTRDPEQRDFVLGATTSRMATDFQQRIGNVRQRLGQLKNKTGGYAADLQDCLDMYEEIAAVIARYRAKKRPTS